MMYTVYIKRHYYVYNFALNVKYLTKPNSFMGTTRLVFFFVAHFSSMLALTVKNIINNQDDLMLYKCIYIFFYGSHSLVKNEVNNV